MTLAAKYLSNVLWSDTKVNASLRTPLQIKTCRRLFFFILLLLFIIILVLINFSPFLLLLLLQHYNIIKVTLLSTQETTRHGWSVKASITHPKGSLDEVTSIPAINLRYRQQQQQKREHKICIFFWSSTK